MGMGRQARGSDFVVTGRDCIGYVVRLFCHTIPSLRWLVAADELARLIEGSLWPTEQATGEKDGIAGWRPRFSCPSIPSLRWLVAVEALARLIEESRRERFCFLLGYVGAYACSVLPSRPCLHGPGRRVRHLTKEMQSRLTE
jgi:hypothetical protein